jgi:hypothetical protein
MESKVLAMPLTRKGSVVLQHDGRLTRLAGGRTLQRTPSVQGNGEVSMEYAPVTLDITGVTMIAGRKA